LSYDIPHRAPWDWRVSLYTWTKSIAAGVYLSGAVAVLLNAIAPTDVVWSLATPLIALIALAVTGLILILDLEHPFRFHLIFTRPQWQSWLVRGAFIIAAYALVLLAQLALSLPEPRADASTRVLLWLGVVTALPTAAYTAYLFAQAKARDLWQSPLAPAHLAVQALIAGAAVMLLAAMVADEATLLFARMLTFACAVHLLVVLGEHTLTHVTAHARLAAREMTRGSYATWFWSSCLLIGAAMATAFWLPAGVSAVAAALAALAGLFAYEHAYVQAGQAVPLA
jgi:formate-dependent nitrite reductase membrane component NrfD